MTSTPSSALPVQTPWYAYLLVDRSRLLRASVALVTGLAMAWSLGAADFGVLQSALALAAILAAITGLGLDSLIRERLKLHPLDTTSTLGTGMALKCGAGIIAYLVLVMVISTQATPRSVWLVAALVLLTQTPLLIGLRFEDAAHRPRALFAHNLALILSCLIIGLLVWCGADAVWFAAAIVLEQPLAGLLLLFSHDRVAPEEETFHWEWEAARHWAKACWKPLGSVLLTLALLPVSQLLVVWCNKASEAGHFGTVAVLFEFGAFCASAILLGRLAKSRTTPDEVPLSNEAATEDDFNGAASVGWILALTVIALSVLFAFTLFRGAALSVSLTGVFLGLGLVPLALGIVRDEYWRRAGCGDRVAQARFIAAVVNLGLSLWLAPKAGAAGVAGSTLVALLVGELVMTYFPGNAPKLAPTQTLALILRGLWHRAPVPAPAPASLAPVGAVNSPLPEASSFMGSLLRPSLTNRPDSSGTVSPNSGAVAKSP